VSRGLGDVYKRQALGATDPGLLWRLYRERVPAILGKAGSVGSVDPRDDGRLILQGGQP
ncbi:protease modulator HflK, partial [Pseudomonas aeruginosa]|nr:protease modulator HflK [Pseudomonas aeruginosa]